MPHNFDEMVLSHRASIIAAYGHIEEQMRSYRMSYPHAYKWIMQAEDRYRLLIIAAGYNSGNTGRAQELEAIITKNPKLSNVEIITRFTH